MTLEELKNYRPYCSELRDIENKLKSGKYEESAVAIRFRKRYLLDKTEAIKRFVKNIREYKVQRAIAIYCLEPLDENATAPSWEEVADRIANGCSGDSIRMAVTRYLKKN